VVLRDRLALSYFGVNVALMTVYGTVFTIFPLAMAADGYDAADFGIVVACNGIGIVLLQPLLSPWLLRKTPALNVGGGALLMAAAMAIVAVSDGLAGYVAAILVITLGEIANAASGPGLVAEIAPPALRGRYAGAFGLTFGLAFAITPLVGGALIGDGSSPTPWILATGIGLATAAWMFALGPRLEVRRRAARRRAAVAA
jgi:MFS family permease